LKLANGTQRLTLRRHSSAGVHRLQGVGEHKLAYLLAHPPTHLGRVPVVETRLADNFPFTHDGWLEAMATGGLPL
jgi:hypothetical protein